MIVLKTAQEKFLAALQAVVLKDCLARGDVDLARRFFAAAAQPLGMVWQANRITGEFVPDLPGWKEKETEVMNGSIGLPVLD